MHVVNGYVVLVIPTFWQKYDLEWEEYSNLYKTQFTYVDWDIQ